MVTTRSAKRISTAGLLVSSQSAPSSGKTFADFPMEIKLMIFDFLDREPQVISLYYWFEISSSMRSMWLRGPHTPPVTLSICSETRAKVLPRYTTLPPPYNNVYVNFKKDSFAVAAAKSSITRPMEKPMLRVADLQAAKNIILVHDRSERWKDLCYKLNCLGSVFPALKHVYPDPRWTFNGVPTLVWEEARARMRRYRRRFKIHGIALNVTKD